MNSVRRTWRCVAPAIVITLLPLWLSCCVKRDSPTATDFNAASQSPLQVGVQQKAPGSTILRVSIRNSTSKTISIAEDFLPWRKRGSMTIVTTPKTTPESCLKPVFYSDDMRPGATVLQPSERREGEIDISHRYPSVASVLRNEGEVLVFWCYDVRSGTGALIGRVFGGCTLRAR